MTITVQSLKVIFEKANKLDNELKWKFDKQLDDIKHLKEQYDNEKEVQEITAAITPRKRKACMCAV